MKSRPLWLSGEMVRRMMRSHKVTIDDLAARFSLTKTRIRKVRADGVSGFLAEEWTFFITGRWPL